MLPDVIVHTVKILKLISQKNNVQNVWFILISKEN
jgi:hypothetical protein